MESEVAAHIRQLAEEAHTHSRGVFSMHPEGVYQKLTQGFPSSGLDFLYYWLRAARFFGVEGAALQWTAGGQLKLAWQGNGPSREELQGLALSGSDGTAYLLLGSLCALHQGFSDVQWRFTQGSAHWSPKGPVWNWQERLRIPGFQLQAGGRKPPTSQALPPLPIDLDWNGRTLKRAALPPSRFQTGPLTAGSAHFWVDGWRLPPPPELQPPTRSQLEIPITADERPLVRLDLLCQRPLAGQGTLWQQRIWQHLLQQPNWTSDWTEWGRARGFPVSHRGSAPCPEDPYAPAYYERAWLQGDASAEAPRTAAWRQWDADHNWELLWQAGCVPWPGPTWLGPTLRSFRSGLARATYRYLLRLQERGPGPDSELLHQLVGYRRDSLGGNYLLAQQLLLSSRWPRTDWAEFCCQYLQAACRGQEARDQVANLTPDERSDLWFLTRQLTQIRSSKG